MSDFYEYEYKDGEKMLDTVNGFIDKKRKKQKKKPPKKEDYYSFATTEEMTDALNKLERDTDKMLEDGADPYEVLVCHTDEITKIIHQTPKERREFAKMIKEKQSKILAGKSPA